MHMQCCLPRHSFPHQTATAGLSSPHTIAIFLCSACYLHSTSLHTEGIFGARAKHPKIIYHQLDSTHLAAHAVPPFATFLAASGHASGRSLMA